MALAFVLEVFGTRSQVRVSVVVLQSMSTATAVHEFPLESDTFFDQDPFVAGIAVPHTVNDASPPASFTVPVRVIPVQETVCPSLCEVKVTEGGFKSRNVDAEAELVAQTLSVKVAVTSFVPSPADNSTATSTVQPVETVPVTLLASPAPLSSKFTVLLADTAIVVAVCPTCDQLANDMAPSLGSADFQKVPTLSGETFPAMSVSFAE